MLKRKALIGDFLEFRRAMAARLKKKKVMAYSQLGQVLVEMDNLMLDELCRRLKLRPQTGPERADMLKTRRTSTLTSRDTKVFEAMIVLFGTTSERRTWLQT